MHLGVQPVSGVVLQGSFRILRNGGNPPFFGIRRIRVNSKAVHFFSIRLISGYYGYHWRVILDALQ